MAKQPTRPTPKKMPVAPRTRVPDTDFAAKKRMPAKQTKKK